MSLTDGRDHTASTQHGPPEMAALREIADSMAPESEKKNWKIEKHIMRQDQSNSSTRN